MAINVYQTILEAHSKGEKLLAILIDPEKISMNQIDSLCNSINNARPDLIFVGGSTCVCAIDSFVLSIKEHIANIPIVLFPGNPTQFTPNADALLFLSLLSGRNADMLIGMQVASARKIQDSHIETISMGYILCEGGKQSAVERVSKTMALSSSKEIIDTAIAGKLLGMQSIYLEAGSGALQPISPTIIQAVREKIDIPLIVGGGICQIDQMNEAFRAGADIVVIGNYFEKHIEQLKDFCDGRR